MSTTVSSVLEPPFVLDSQGMAARIRAIPEQIDDALAACAAAPWRVPDWSPEVLAVGALGGSAIAADLTGSLWSDSLPHPLLCVREYQWPAWAGPATLAVLCSYSGNTEETLALYDGAGARGMPRVAMTTGGTLAERCVRDHVPYAILPAGSPPRAALYASWVRLTYLVHALGWIADPGPEWREASGLITRRREQWAPEVPEAQNPAKQLARRLHGKFLFLYAGSDRLGPVTTRVRNQINENAKLLAHSAVVPELNHNEVVGWENPLDLESRSAVVMLRDAEDPDLVALRLSLTAEYVRQQGAEVVVLEEEEGSRLARIVSLVVLGDYLSLYLAMLNAVDPTPIASIDWFKHRLAESRNA